MLAESLFYDFVTLLAIVNPVQAVAAFASITADEPRDAQNRIALRASVTSLVLLIAFGFAGEYLLKALGISFAAFRVAGGLLLLMVGFNMVFAKDGSPHHAEAAPSDDPSVFPLAIPMIAGPGALTTMVALVSKRRESGLEVLLVAVLAVVVMAITYVSMRMSGRVLNAIGQTGVSAVSRIVGIIVASIAVQLMVNGLRELFPVLAR